MARANTMADITAGLADSTPDLSVIICNYRSAAIIQSCLASLCGQDYPAERYDIVIIDDGSQDESAEIIQRFIEDRAGKHPKISYHRKENEGLSIARNDGIRRSRGAIITYIDDDAVADRQFIIQVMASFREHPEANCVGGRVDLLNPENRFARLMQYSIMGWYMSQNEVIVGTNMSYRRGFLEEIGGFQPEFTRRGDETALFTKAGERLRKVVNPQVIVSHRQPESAGEWIRKRWESGHFEAAVDYLKYRLEISRKKPTIKLLGRVAHLLGPWITIAVLLFNLPAGLICLFGYLTLLVRRYIMHRVLTGPLRELAKTKTFTRRWSDYLLVTFLVLMGGYWADRGYFRGYFHFRGVSWQTPRIQDG